MIHEKAFGWTKTNGAIYDGGKLIDRWLVSPPIDEFAFFYAKTDRQHMERVFSSSSNSSPLCPDHAVRLV